MGFVAVALPICGDHSADGVDCRRRGDSSLFLRAALDASIVEGARRHDDLDVSVVNTAHTGIERHLGTCRFVSRRACRSVSTHRICHSVESHGGMVLLDCASANAPSESQSRADIVCLVFRSSSFFHKQTKKTLTLLPRKANTEKITESDAAPPVSLGDTSRNASFFAASLPFFPREQQVLTRRVAPDRAYGLAVIPVASKLPYACSSHPRELKRYTDRREQGRVKRRVELQSETKEFKWRKDSAKKPNPTQLEEHGPIGKNFERASLYILCFLELARVLAHFGECAL